MLNPEKTNTRKQYQATIRPITADPSSNVNLVPDAPLLESKIEEAEEPHEQEVADELFDQIQENMDNSYAAKAMLSPLKDIIHDYMDNELPSNMERKESISSKISPNTERSEKESINNEFLSTFDRSDKDSLNTSKKSHRYSISSKDGEFIPPPPSIPRSLSRKASVSSRASDLPPLPTKTLTPIEDLPPPPPKKPGQRERSASIASSTGVPPPPPPPPPVDAQKFEQESKETLHKDHNGNHDKPQPESSNLKSSMNMTTISRTAGNTLRDEISSRLSSMKNAEVVKEIDSPSAPSQDSGSADSMQAELQQRLNRRRNLESEMLTNEPLKAKQSEEPKYTIPTLKKTSQSIKSEGGNNSGGLADNELFRKLQKKRMELDGTSDNSGMMTFLISQNVNGI